MVVLMVLVTEGEAVDAEVVSGRFVVVVPKDKGYPLIFIQVVHISIIMNI